MPSMKYQESKLSEKMKKIVIISALFVNWEFALSMVEVFQIESDFFFFNVYWILPYRMKNNATGREYARKNQ